jgi:hypothetical protein
VLARVGAVQARSILMTELNDVVGLSCVSMHGYRATGYDRPLSVTTPGNMAAQLTCIAHLNATTDRHRTQAETKLSNRHRPTGGGTQRNQKNPEPSEIRQDFRTEHLYEHQSPTHTTTPTHPHGPSRRHVHPPTDQPQPQRSRPPTKHRRRALRKHIRLSTNHARTRSPAGKVLSIARSTYRVRSKWRSMATETRTVSRREPVLDRRCFFQRPVLGASSALPGWCPAGRLPRVQLPEMVIRLWSRLERRRIHHQTGLIMLGGWLAMNVMTELNDIVVKLSARAVRGDAG